LELFQIATVHQSREPGSDAATRVLRLELDPAATDRLVELFRGITGMLDEIPGLCRAAQFIDRQRDQAVVALTYADWGALAGSRSAAAAVRARSRAGPPSRPP
jgi:hypothetical protein